MSSVDSLQGLVRHNRNGTLGRLLLPENAGWLFTIVVAVAYGLAPLIVYELFLPGDVFVKLAIITGVAVVGLLLGAHLPLCDGRFRAGATRVKLRPHAFHIVTWAAFSVFLLVTVLTAPSIPLFSALQGAGSDVLGQERGDFLKGREGAWIALLYVSTFMVSTIVPYSLVLQFAQRSRYRFLSAAIFFLFCISFLAKSLFLNVLLPLLAYLAISDRLTDRRVIVGTGATFLILAMSMFLAVGDVGSDGTGSSDPAQDDYLSAVYTPSGPMEYFAWRAGAVPIFTATDTLVVHEEIFGGEPLMGATSSLLAAAFGLTRVNLERHVFEHQFGSWNEIANANAFYAVDAFANFGFTGVFVFSLVAGQMFRWFRLSRDVAFKSLWPIFALSLYSASMLGLFFSNGFLYMALHAAFVRVDGGRA